jgi:hypothetical protein
MIAQSSPTERYLLYFFFHSHVQNPLGVGLNIISQHEVISDVPYLQVISSSGEKKILLIKHY